MNNSFLTLYRDSEATGNQPGINPEFADLFKFNSPEDQLEHMAHMVSFRALSEIEKICEEMEITHKRLAEVIAVSESYLSQIFNGDKQINTSFLARVEKALGVRFEFNVVNLHDEKSPYIPPAPPIQDSDEQMKDFAGMVLDHYKSWDEAKTLDELLEEYKKTINK